MHINSRPQGKNVSSAYITVTFVSPAVMLLLQLWLMLYVARWSQGGLSGAMPQESQKKSELGHGGEGAQGKNFPPHALWLLWEYSYSWYKDQETYHLYYLSTRYSYAFSLSFGKGDKWWGAKVLVFLRCVSVSPFLHQVLKDHSTFQPKFFLVY